jgi:GTP-binding protein
VTRSTPSSNAAIAPSSSSTPRASAASAGIARHRVLLELRARDAAERAYIALILVDTSEGLVDHDLTIADIARKAQDSTIVVLSKWDVTTLGIEDIRPELERRLKQRPPHVAVSSKTGRGVERLLDAIEKLYDKHTSRVSTAELNRFLAEPARAPATSREGRA